MHVLVIGQQGVGLTAVAVDVPHPQHGQQNGHVLLQGGSVEVIILHDTKESYTSDKATAIPPNSFIVFIIDLVLIQCELPTNCHFNITEEDVGNWTLRINLLSISLLTTLKEEQIWNRHLNSPSSGLLQADSRSCQNLTMERSQFVFTIATQTWFFL